MHLLLVNISLSRCLYLILKIHNGESFYQIYSLLKKLYDKIFLKFVLSYVLIYKILIIFKEGKYIIYCGYQHAYEGIHKSWEKTMAGRLSDLTGINPLTIDQTQFSEKSNPKYNEPLLGMINNTTPVVLKDENQVIYNGEDKILYTDIKIVHPITKYLKGRPDWMLTGSRKLYKIPSSEIPVYPVLVLAYRKGEFEQKGIPADIIELNTSKDSRSLILDKGNYEIVIKNKEYKVINRFEKMIR